MKLLDSLRFRIAALLQRSQMNAEMEEELRSRIQHRAEMNGALFAMINGVRQ